MALTSHGLLALKRFEGQLPELSPEDKAYVLGHMVALETAGISSDGNRERSILERLILQFGWRLAYCRSIEKQFGSPNGYDAWFSSQSGLCNVCGCGKLLPSGKCDFCDLSDNSVKGCFDGESCSEGQKC